MSRRYVRDLRGRFAEVGGSGQVSTSGYLTTSSRRATSRDGQRQAHVGHDVLIEHEGQFRRGKIEELSSGKTQAFVRDEDGQGYIKSIKDLHKIVADHDNSVVSKDDLASRVGKADSTLGADREAARAGITADIDKLAGPYVGRRDSNANKTQAQLDEEDYQRDLATAKREQREAEDALQAASGADTPAAQRRRENLRQRVDGAKTQVADVIESKRNTAQLGNTPLIGAYSRSRPPMTADLVEDAQGRRGRVEAAGSPRRDPLIRFDDGTTERMPRESLRPQTGNGKDNLKGNPLADTRDRNTTGASANDRPAKDQTKATGLSQPELDRSADLNRQRLSDKDLDKEIQRIQTAGPSKYEDSSTLGKLQAEKAARAGKSSDEIARRRQEAHTAMGGSGDVYDRVSVDTTPAGRRGPGSSDKIKNAATMYGEGSWQHEEAKRRFSGSPAEQKLAAAEDALSRARGSRSGATRGVQTDREVKARARVEAAREAVRVENARKGETETAAARAQARDLETPQQRKNREAYEAMGGDAADTGPKAPPKADAGFDGRSQSEVRAEAKRERARARREAAKKPAEPYVRRDLTDEDKARVDASQAALREDARRKAREARVRRNSPEAVAERERLREQAENSPAIKQLQGEVARGEITVDPDSALADRVKAAARIEAKRERARKRRQAAKESPGK